VAYLLAGAVGCVREDKAVEIELGDELTAGADEDMRIEDAFDDVLLGEVEVRAYGVAQMREPDTKLGRRETAHDIAGGFDRSTARQI
jgi:hypothetical protein